MEKFLDYYGDSYFTDLFCLIATAFGTIYFYKNAIQEFKIFIFYFLFFFIAQCFFALSNAIEETSFYPAYKKSQQSVDFTLTIIEVIAFYKFFYEGIQSSYRKILVFFAIVFFGISFFLLINDLSQHGYLKLHTLEKIFIWESFILLVPCILYFNSMFKKLPPTPIMKDPYFWIASGLMFFALSTLPFSFLMNYIRLSNIELYNSLYTIVNIFYFFLFITLIKALSCRLKSIN